MEQTTETKETMNEEQNERKEQSEEVVDNDVNVHSEEEVNTEDAARSSDESAQTDSTNAAHNEGDTDDMQQKLKAAEAKADEYYQKLLRTQADFDNFRRRTRKEKEDQSKYAALPLIEQLLPALDNFERALSAGNESADSDSFIKGVEMVFNQVKQALVDQGLEEIETVGQPFDPHVHQAVMQVEDDQYESGIVVEELQKGYRLKDKVIRPAMVKVNA